MNITVIKSKDELENMCNTYGNGKYTPNFHLKSAWRGGDWWCVVWETQTWKWTISGWTSLDQL